MVSKFDEQKKEIECEIQAVIDRYVDFTSSVSPKHWRTTGHDITELRKVKRDVMELTEMTEDEKKFPYVKEELEKNK